MGTVNVVCVVYLDGNSCHVQTFLDSEDVHIDFPKHVYIGKLTVVDLTKAVTPYVYVYTSADVYSGVV